MLPFPPFQGTLSEYMHAVESVYLTELREAHPYISVVKLARLAGVSRQCLRTKLSEHHLTGKD